MCLARNTNFRTHGVGLFDNIIVTGMDKRKSQTNFPGGCYGGVPALKDMCSYTEPRNWIAMEACFTMDTNAYLEFGIAWKEVYKSGVPMLHVVAGEKNLSSDA